MTHSSATDNGHCVAVVGMFDGVHAGHRHLLGQLGALAAETGLRPLVITFSNHPLEVIAPERAPRLLTSADEKRRLIATALPGARVEVMPFDDALRLTSAAGFLDMLRDRYGVRALLLGFNNRFGHDAPRDFAAYARLGREAGVQIHLATECAGASSSAVRALLAEGDAAGAAEMLGRPYTLTGHVEAGRRIGRTIGFPTANVRPDDERRLVPAPGVYACRATVGAADGSRGTADDPAGAVFPAMVNIGRRPTIGEGLDTTVEAHLIGLDADLYGREVTLEFVERLRAERRFDSLAALAAQLDADRAATLAALGE